MALVIVGWLTTACVLLYQGIYILRTGYVTLFFSKPERSRLASGPFSRIAHAFVYLFPGVAAVIILAITLFRVGISRLVDWVIGNFGTLFWPLCAIALGIPTLLRPEQTLRRTLPQNPELVNDNFVVLITRFIAAGFVLVGFAILATLKP
jgi:magnesium-transporting ATPase (P-type)